jgi:hypothetical protein
VSSKSQYHHHQKTKEINTDRVYFDCNTHTHTHRERERERERERNPTGGVPSEKKKYFKLLLDS